MWYAIRNLQMVFYFENWLDAQWLPGSVSSVRDVLGLYFECCRVESCFWDLEMHWWNHKHCADWPRSAPVAVAHFSCDATTRIIKPWQLWVLFVHCYYCWYNMKYMLAYLLTSKTNKSAPKAPQVHENTRVEKGQLSFMLTGSQVIDWCDCLDTQVCQCFLPSSFFPFSCSFLANGLQPSVTLRGLPMTSSFSSSTAAPKQSCIKAWAFSRSFNNFIHHYKTQAALWLSKNNDLC